MLAHQLPALPPLDALLSRVPAILDWLDPDIVTATMPLSSLAVTDDETLVEAGGVKYWGLGVPVDIIRFAGSNRILVEFAYGGRTRRVEPYSLRTKRTGNLLLYAWEIGAAHIKAFNVAKITHVNLTDTPFAARYVVEF